MKTVIVLAIFLLFMKVTGEEPEETTTENIIGASVEADSDEWEVSKVYSSAEWLNLTKSERKYITKKSEQLEQIFNKKLDSPASLKFRPNSYGPPVDVIAEVEIRELLSISEVDMEISLKLVMEVFWEDPRLALSKQDGILIPDGGVWLDKSVKEKIWIPQVSILNEKESVDHSAGFVQETLKWDGQFGMTLRVNLVTTLPCPMSLERFPMDEQNCSILIGSPSYSDKQMKLDIRPYVHPAFSSSEKNVEVYGLRYLSLGESFERTIFSYELLFRRYAGYYIIGTFFPSALVVFISWLTFWMSRDAAGERMALGVTCVLTITTLLISSQASAPKVSYVKAIDIYMGVCFTLVFSTLLQSTTVGYLLRKVRIQEGLRKVEAAAENGGAHPQGFASIVHHVMSGGLEADEKPKVIKFILGCDVWCRLAYPLIFAIFNVVYWVYYMNVTKLDYTKNWIGPKTYDGLLDDRDFRKY